MMSAVPLAVVEMADADYAWAYVIVGWVLTAVVLAAYLGWLVSRIRRAQRSLPPESDR
jgi:hypothetical protein